MIRSIVTIIGLLIGSAVFAQNKISAVLVDSSNGEPVPFATVSLTRDGAKKPDAYNLSTESGEVVIAKVHKGSYLFKAELLGYKAFEKHIRVDGDLDLGKVSMNPDKQMLDAASVSAVGVSTSAGVSGSANAVAGNNANAATTRRDSHALHIVSSL